MNWLNAALTTVVDTVAPVIQDAVNEEGWSDTTPGLEDRGEDYTMGSRRDERRRRSPAYERGGEEEGGEPRRDRRGRESSPEHGGGEGDEAPRSWEEERVELIGRLHEAESALEASSKEWQGTVRQMQEVMMGVERSRDSALSVLGEVGQQVVGWLGPKNAEELRSRLAIAKASSPQQPPPPPAKQPFPYGGNPSRPPPGLPQVVGEVVQQAGMERSRLLAGLGEILGAPPPPAHQDVDLLLLRIREAIYSQKQLGGVPRASSSSSCPLPEVTSPALEEPQKLGEDANNQQDPIIKPSSPSPPAPGDADVRRLRESLQAGEQRLAQERKIREAAEAQLATLQEEVAGLRAHREEAAHSLNTRQQEVSELRSQLAEVMNARQSQGQEVEKLKAALAEAEDGNQQLLSRLQGFRTQHQLGEAMQGRFSVAEGEKRELKKQLEEVRRRMEDVERAKKVEEDKGRKKEHEANQLREVVDQCRSAMRIKGEELEKVKKEKEEMLRRVEEAEGQLMKLYQEKESHVKSIREAQAQQHDVVGLQSQLSEVMERAEKREEQLRQQTLDLHTRLQETEHAVHDLTAQLAAAQADVGLLSRDYEQAETARMNLQKVLEQFQWEKASEIRLLESNHSKAMEAQEEAFATKEAHIRRMYESQVEDAKGEAESARESYEVEKIKVRSESEQARKEALSLRRALDEAIKRLQSSNSETSETVDRRLVGNLVVSYFVQRQSRDVLDVIAKTLGLTDEERVSIGLRPRDPLSVSRGSGLLGGLFATVTTGFVGSPRKEFVPPNAENTPLGDLWVQYLLEETDELPEGQEPHATPRGPMGGGGLPSPGLPPGPTPRNFTFS